MRVEPRVEAPMPAARGPLEGLPGWALEMARMYRGGTISEFILHGNVHDLVPVRREDDDVSFVPLRDFLAESLFPTRDTVIFYDHASGITFSDNGMMADFQRVASAVDTVSGTTFSKALPRDPVRALWLIERYIRSGIQRKKPRRIAVIIDYAETVAAAGDMGSMSRDELSTLVTLLKWASDPVFLKADVTICLIAENLADLNLSLVRSPYAAKVPIGLPDEAERREFIEQVSKGLPFEDHSALPPEALAKLTAGLSRINLHHMIHQAIRNGEEISLPYVQEEKKRLIEKECYGLLEFLQPTYTLDMVCGLETAKGWLLEDARLLSEGRHDALPMGYLICGPVGTGKTFLSQCYTGTIGIPCVKLLNFRSQWQGVTEGNWEKILNVLKATGPVGVIIDEADAAVGSRQQRGDSGTSARVFSQLASQMGDTRYRGKILWFLLTCRPDLLPVDLKRQGRAEVHIPLFYPDSKAERMALYEAMARKIGAKLGEGCLEVASTKSPSRISGAEIEGILVRAQRRALLSHREEVSTSDLDEELSEYLPPQFGEEVDLQILAAVAECTDRRFLPAEYRDADRKQIAQRVAELKRFLP